MTAPNLSPLNDLVFLITIKVPDATGTLVNLETGTASTFIADSDDPKADAADPSLVGDVSYTGANGRWLVGFDASILDPDLLDGLFEDGTKTPYCIIQVNNNIRGVVELAYVRSRLVTVTA